MARSVRRCGLASGSLACELPSGNVPRNHVTMALRLRLRAPGALGLQLRAVGSSHLVVEVGRGGHWRRDG